MLDFLPTFMYNFPSGGYLAFWVGIVLAVATAGIMFFIDKQQYVLPALGLIATCAALVVGGLGVTNTEHAFDSYILSGNGPHPATPWWVMSLLLAVIIAMLVLVVKAIKQRTWMQVFAFGTLMLVAGAAFSQGGLFSQYEDGWALANTSCWLAAGATAIALIINLVRNFCRMRVITKPSDRIHPFVDAS